MGYDKELVCPWEGCTRRPGSISFLQKPSPHAYAKFCHPHRRIMRNRHVRMPTKTKAQRRKRQLVIYQQTIVRLQSELHLLRDELSALKSNQGQQEDLIRHFDDKQRTSDKHGHHELARSYRSKRDFYAIKRYGEPFCYHDGENADKEICECGARMDER